VDNHERVSVKALLDSRATGMFADKKFVEKNSFKLVSSRDSETVGLGLN